MTKLIRSPDSLDRNGFLNRWFDNRIKKNKNIIIAFTGATGSGKSYNTISVAEAWYLEKFHEGFPKENICFSLGELTRRINDLNNQGKLRKGEVMIMEEAGANFGNLDFQNKLSKMFSYILQSFRSMNLILLFSLPVLNMVNKTARQLVHAHFITTGIDYINNVAKVKPLFHQLNQGSGKSYWKFPRVRINGKMITLKRLTFDLPSEKIIKEYEEKKNNFVYGLTEEFVFEINKIDNDKKKEREREKNKEELTPVQERIFKLAIELGGPEPVAGIVGRTVRTVYSALQRAKRKGWDYKKFLQNQKVESHGITNPPTPIT